jgi:methylated-DNA-[protein]-cysteine S-methyltransferase
VNGRRAPVAVSEQKSLVVDTPIGPLTLTASDAGLHTVRFQRDREPSPSEPSPPAPASATGSGHPVLAEAAAQLSEYFAGRRREFDLPLAPAGTPFQLAAWRALLEIPYATTVSYGEQARRLGGTAKTRAVGAANGRNPIPVIIPCHRVVGADGTLVGFGGGLETKAWLLDHERAVAGVALDLH